MLRRKARRINIMKDHGEITQEGGVCEALPNLAQNLMQLPVCVSKANSRPLCAVELFHVSCH